jgi:hypothetical protein
MKVLLLSWFLACSSIAHALVQFSDFENILRSPAGDSIENILGALPMEMRQNFVNIYKSHSLQQSSPENPRTLLFDSTGSLILTFNGSPDQYGYHSIESAEFNVADQRIRYREIIFRKDLKIEKPEIPWTEDSLIQTAALAKDEIAFFDDRVLVTKANPSKCMGCHADNIYNMNNIDGSLPDRKARYIWPTYPTWQGIYGSNDSGPDAAHEPQNYAHFRSLAAQNPRYRFLQFGSDSTLALVRGNERFGVLIGNRYSKQSARKIWDGLQTAQDRYSLLQTFLGCSKAQSLWEFNSQSPYPALRTVVTEQLKALDFPKGQISLLLNDDSIVPLLWGDGYSNIFALERATTQEKYSQYYVYSHIAVELWNLAAQADSTLKNYLDEARFLSRHQPYHFYENLLIYYGPEAQNILADSLLSLVSEAPVEEAQVLLTKVCHQLEQPRPAL